MRKLAGWTLALASAVALVMGTSAQAQHAAGLQAALSPYLPHRQTCYDGVGTAEGEQVARARAAAITACDAFAQGVDEVIEQLQPSTGEKTYLMSLAADAMRVKGGLQIDGGETTAGLNTLAGEVMSLLRFTSTTREGGALALSSQLQVETALQLYKVGRTAEADSVLTNMRGVMDRITEMGEGQPSFRSMMTRMSSQGGTSEAELARTLPQGEWSDAEWSRRRLEAYIRSERWRFRGAVLGETNPLLGSLARNVQSARSEMGRLQERTGDQAGANLSYAAAMVAACAKGDYPSIDKSAAARTALADCIGRDPMFNFGLSTVITEGRLGLDESGSMAARGGPLVNRVIDYLGSTATQAAPPQ